jgi:hypothetical protein
VRFRSFALAALLVCGLPLSSQIRVERDSKGQIVITNKGSKAAARLDGSQSAAPIPKVSPALRGAIRARLKTACAEKGLDYDLVAALVQAESDFQPNTLSKKGAIGLMQLMPDTARRFGCKDPWDWEENIKGGVGFLSYLHELFSGDVPLILAAYNAGEDAVRKYSNKIPPYAETVRYVFTILNDYGRPALVQQAKTKLASPSDYDRFYVARKSYQVPLRTLYMYLDSHGVRCFTDAPPSGVKATLIVFKDE